MWIAAGVRQIQVLLFGTFWNLKKIFLIIGEYTDAEPVDIEAWPHEEDKSLHQESAIDTDATRKLQDVLVKLLLGKKRLEVDDLSNPGVSTARAGVRVTRPILTSAGRNLQAPGNPAELFGWFLTSDDHHMEK